jgi:hypothetical protein
MTEADKEVQRIIREYKLTPSKLLFVEDVKQEEINNWFENIKEDLINYIRCCKRDSEQLKVFINKDTDVDLLSGFKARLIGFRPEQFEVVYNHNDAVDWVNADEVSVKSL